MTIIISSPPTGCELNFSFAFVVPLNFWNNILYTGHFCSTVYSYTVHEMHFNQKNKTKQNIKLTLNEH